jgi:hypothetical protein
LLISSWVAPPPPTNLPTSNRAASRRASSMTSADDEAVVHDDVGLLQRAQALQGHEAGLPGPAPTRHDVSGGMESLFSERLARERLGLRHTLGTHGGGHGPVSIHDKNRRRGADLGELGFDGDAPAIGERRRAGRASCLERSRVARG